jgi:soluble calcium-activated nucleotidase 1
MNKMKRRELILAPLLIGLFWTIYSFTPRAKSLRGETVTSGYYYFEHQKPYLKYDADSTYYNFVIIADKDKRSKNGNIWESILKRGKLEIDPTGKYSIRWSSEEILKTTLSEAGRGMELSELVWFNGKLLAPDDRTGVVYAIEHNQAYPVHILMDGDGKSNKGFKGEWATVKDNSLYIGSVGKEYTDNDGNILNHNPQFVKIIQPSGNVQHVDWSAIYTKLRKAAGASYPGYLMHEAASWNPVLKKWFFFPRRHSTLSYDDKEDERRGTNIMISADADFDHVEVSKIGPLTLTRGFSSIVFLPGRETIVLALKSEEVEDVVASYITVLNVVTGEVLLEEEYINDIKFEGVEII